MQPPTTREIILVVTLLFTLITLSKHRHEPIVPDLDVSPSDHSTRTNLSQPSEVSLYAPSPRIAWGDGPVPHTTLVAHVPGKSAKRENATNTPT